MVIQAFIDDSSTPGGVFVLAGHIASADVWARFSKEWEELLPFGVRAKDGKFHFKMSEMAANAERMERVGAFYRLIENHDLISISCKINVAEFRHAMSRLWVPNLQFDWGPYADPFIFTFRILVDTVSEQRDKMAALTDEKIDFIFDDQSQKKIILAAWEQYMESKSPEARNRFGATPRFEDDRAFLPLQAADLWAWWVREWYEQGYLVEMPNDGMEVRLKGVVDSKKTHRSIFISYNEEQLIVTLKSILEALFPNEVIYDSCYEGKNWSL